MLQKLNNEKLVDIALKDELNRQFIEGTWHQALSQVCKDWVVLHVTYMQKLQYRRVRLYNIRTKLSTTVAYDALHNFFWGEVKDPEHNRRYYNIVG